jgi:hypothetical protein
MTTIYDKHAKTFGNVSAYVIMKDGERIATVAFKFGNAVTAYVHIVGSEMQFGIAKGGGYDRQSAAVAIALGKLPESPLGEHLSLNSTHYSLARIDAAKAFRAAGHRDNGAGWVRHVEDAGFEVWQAV